jgi:hypothetical protein
MKTVRALLGSAASKPVPSVTRVYGYPIRFAPASHGVPDDQRSLVDLMVRRMRLVPEHRIEIVAYEEADPDGCLAGRRAEAVESLLLEASIDPSRIRRQVSGSERTSRVDVQILPCVPSLSGRSGDSLLDLEEVRTIGRARKALLFGCKTERQALEHESHSIDWQRLSGHASLDEWARAGGRHPLYDELVG